MNNQRNAIRAQLQQVMQNSPEVQQAIQQGLVEVRNDPDMTPENIQQVINLLEQVLVDPSQYPQMRQMLLQIGVDELPEQYDPMMIGVFLMVLYQAIGQQFARGGLARMAERVRNEGRGGDTVLAHISPFEASVLRQYGGSGRINPQTGLPEYGFWKSLKKVFKIVAPIALAIFAAPLLATSLVSAGMGATMAGITAGAAVGAGGALITGGDPLKGALFGGLGAGVGDVIGGAANTQLGLGLGKVGTSILGSTIAGAGIGAITGEGAAKGALQGLAGGTLGQTVSGLAGTGTGAVAEGIRSAGSTMGNMTTMGYTPKEVLIGGAVSGLATGVGKSQGWIKDAPTTSEKAPVDSAQRTQLDQQLQDGTITRAEYSRQTGLTDAQIGPTGPIVSDAQASANLKALNAKYLGEVALGTPPEMAASAIGSNVIPVAAPVLPPGTPATTLATTLATTPATAPFTAITPVTPASTGIAGTEIGLNMKTLGAGMALMSLLGAAQTPEQVQQAAAGSNMSNAQKEYFSRNIQYWDWNELQNRAKFNNQGLGEYLAKNWNTVAEETRYQGDTSGEVTSKCMGGRVKKMATGGPLSRLATGGGSGRDDTILARLSDGEYVIDAETVALLGDGSVDEGARRLDAFRSNIRKQKGKVLARGKISPNAKSPLAYLKGAM